MELITYQGPDGNEHQSYFVKGFARRESSDPKNCSVSGVGMEGSGYIDSFYHGEDKYLASQIKNGFGVLVNDSCSSCSKDDHVDLLMPINFSKELGGPARIYKVSRGNCPVN